MRSLLRIVALTTLLYPVFGQTGIRSFPDDNLGYPVLITVGAASAGSGFYYVEGNSVYLVTATHVLYAPPAIQNGPRSLYGSKIDLLSYSKDSSDTTPNRVHVDTTVLDQSNIIRHPTADVSAVKLFEFGSGNPGPMNPVKGVTLLQVAKAGFLIVGSDSVSKLNEVLVGNDVYLFGYPISLALSQDFQIDPERPLLRKGIVAGINRFTHSIILDCPSYPGNSGGPVVEVDTVDAFSRRFRLIGVVDQFVPFSAPERGMPRANSGYSVIIPMDFVLELVNGH
jgi:hypothetical protein